MLRGRGTWDGEKSRTNQQRGKGFPQGHRLEAGCSVAHPAQVPGKADEGGLVPGPLHPRARPGRGSWQQPAMRGANQQMGGLLPSIPKKINLKKKGARENGMKIQCYISDQLTEKCGLTIKMLLTKSHL